MMRRLLPDLCLLVALLPALVPAGSLTPIARVQSAVFTLPVEIT